MAEAKFFSEAWFQGGAVLVLILALVVAISVLWRALSARDAKIEALQTERLNDVKTLIPAVRTLEEVTRALGERRRS